MLKTLKKKKQIERLIKGGGHIFNSIKKNFSFNKNDRFLLTRQCTQPQTLNQFVSDGNKRNDIKYK